MKIRTPDTTGRPEQAGRMIVSRNAISVKIPKVRVATVSSPALNR